MADQQLDILIKTLADEHGAKKVEQALKRVKREQESGARLNNEKVTPALKNQTKAQAEVTRKVQDTSRALGAGIPILSRFTELMKSAHLVVVGLATYGLNALFQKLRQQNAEMEEAAKNAEAYAERVDRALNKIRLTEAFDPTESIESINKVFNLVETRATRTQTTLNEILSAFEKITGGPATEKKEEATRAVEDARLQAASQRIFSLTLELEKLKGELGGEAERKRLAETLPIKIEDQTKTIDSLTGKITSQTEKVEQRRKEAGSFDEEQGISLVDRGLRAIARRRLAKSEEELSRLTVEERTAREGRRADEELFARVQRQEKLQKERMQRWPPDAILDRVCRRIEASDKACASSIAPLRMNNYWPQGHHWNDLEAYLSSRNLPPILRNGLLPCMSSTGCLVGKLTTYAGK